MRLRVFIPLATFIHFIISIALILTSFRSGMSDSVDGRQLYRSYRLLVFMREVFLFPVSIVKSDSIQRGHRPPRRLFV